MIFYDDMKLVDLKEYLYDNSVDRDSTFLC